MSYLPTPARQNILAITFDFDHDIAARENPSESTVLHLMEGRLE